MKALYRQFMKGAIKIPEEELKRDTIAQIRVEFQRNIHITDKATVAALFADAKRRLEMLKSISSPSHASSEHSTWLSTDDDEDQRGRVGTDWPWQR